MPFPPLFLFISKFSVYSILYPNSVSSAAERVNRIIQELVGQCQDSGYGNSFTVSSTPPPTFQSALRQAGHRILSDSDIYSVSFSLDRRWVKVTLGDEGVGGGGGGN